MGSSVWDSWPSSRWPGFDSQCVKFFFFVSRTVIIFLMQTYCFLGGGVRNFKSFSLLWFKHFYSVGKNMNKRTISIRHLSSLLGSWWVVKICGENMVDLNLINTKSVSYFQRVEQRSKGLVLVVLSHFHDKRVAIFDMLKTGRFRLVRIAKLCVKRQDN